jgi:7-carboxy-7-deazaguanine synthase
VAYTVKEIFKTLQGEGANSGRVALFCRFTGCNLWSGREQDRHKATCQFCDTDFVGGDSFPNAIALADAIEQCWGTPTRHRRFVVFTGGEPLLQLDDALLDAVQARGFVVAVETNGTIAAPAKIDWLTVSPKAGSDAVQRDGNELKLVYPQEGLAPEDVADWDFDRFYLQPMDGERREENTRAAIRYCLEHPQWALSLQTHKLVGIP